MKQGFKKLTIALSVFVLLFTSTGVPVFATMEEDVYLNNQEAHPSLDIRRTMSNTFISASLWPMTLITGLSVGQVEECVFPFFTEQILAGSNLPTWLQNLVNDIADTPDYCDQLKNPLMVGRTSGSLMGMTVKLQHIVENEPIPVNLAFFTQKYAQKIPGLKNTAFAQGDVVYNAPTLNFVFNVWVVVRNLAYGVLALAMLVIGIMIMTRKEISPRVNVTVQNALPRVIIALILITFSYPIGALVASLVKPLALAPVGIFRDLASELSLPGVLLGMGGYFTVLLFVIVLAGLFTNGTGSLIIIVGIIIYLLIFFTLSMMILIKVLVAFYKIVISIVLSPLTFAFGAVPGNESATVTWFKKLAVNLISAPALTFGLMFSIYVALQALEVLRNINLNDFLGITVESIMIALAAPFLTLFILFATVKIPGQLEDAFLETGGKKKK